MNPATGEEMRLIEAWKKEMRYRLAVESINRNLPILVQEAARKRLYAFMQLQGEEVRKAYYQAKAESQTTASLPGQFEFHR